MSKLSQIKTDLLFFLFLGFIIITRTIIYFRYNLNLIDTDQAYMWLGAVDFSNGHFYEPRYYGQDYNTFMEAFLASPLLHFNWKVYEILPIITNLLSLFPYFFTAIYLYLKNQKYKALIVLGIIICMPSHYDLINTLPRGFVTGIFFCSGFILSIVNPQSIFLLFFNTVMSVLGYYINQNSVLVSVPFLFYIFLIHRTNKTYYYATGTAMLFAYPFDLFFNAFYRKHPDYVMQSTFNTFDLKFFTRSISHLDERFQHLTFFIPNQCYTLLAGFGILAFLLYKHNRKAFFAFCVFIALLLFSFFAGKISDGSTWVYMSFSRMFLGIPLLLALCIACVNFQFKKQTAYLLVIPTLFAFYKLSTLKTQLDKEDIRDIARGVRLISISSVKETCNFYKSQCEKQNCNFFLVSSTFWINTILADAGPALDEHYPETEETRFEKRYWVREKNKNRLITRFVFLSSDYHLENLLPVNAKFKLKRLDDYGLYLVENNQLNMGNFIETINQIEPGLND